MIKRKKNTGPCSFSLLSAFQYIALINIAIAQPLYTVLKNSPELFTAHNITGLSLITGSFFLSIGLAIIVFLVTFLLSRLNKYLGIVFHSILLVALVIFFISPLLKNFITDDYILLTLSIITGILVGIFICRNRSIRQWLVFVSIAGLIFPIIFLTSSNIRPLISSKNKPIELRQSLNDIPVILVIFDQLPLHSLIDSDGRINKDLYPNFSAFSEQANWFRNATSTAQDTITGIPAILTGNYPKGKKAPTINVYPNNLFTYLGSSFKKNIIEHATNLQVSEYSNSVGGNENGLYSLSKDVYLIYLHMILPTIWTDHLPSIEDKNSHFWPTNNSISSSRESASNRLNKFINNFSEDDRSLHYLHIDIPHGPYRYYASGKKYTWASSIPGLNKLWGWWPKDETPVKKALQRFLLQVQLTDSYLGNILSRLKDIGIYDKSLIIVTSDHGASFRTSEHTRAAIRNNLHDVLFVPLFIKFPTQKKGRLVDLNVETIDIFPTIIDVLDGDKSWKLDGISLLDEDRQKSTKKAWVTRDGKTGLHELPDLEKKGFEELKPMSRHFIWDAKLLWPRIKSNRDHLIGKDINDVSDQFHSFDHRDRGFSFDKTLTIQEAERELASGWIRGTVSLPRGYEGIVKYAVLLRKKIIAISSTFKHKDKDNYFAELLPEHVEKFDASQIEVRVLKNIYEH